MTMRNKETYEIPRSLFDQRIERVQAFAVERNLAAVFVFSSPRIHQWSQTGHVGYLTNWSNLDRTVDTAVIVPREGEAALLMPGVEFMLDQVAQVSWTTDVRLVSSPDPRSISRAYDLSVGGEEAAGAARSFGAETTEILKENGLNGLPIGISGIESLPTSIYQDLTNSVSGGITNIPDIVADLRQYKSPEEITLLKESASISDMSYRTKADIVDMIARVIKTLNREEGLTILLVEQKLPFTRAVADHFAILDRGSKVAEGGVNELDDELVKKYLTV